MGNCQAAEAATVVIVHPDKKVERIYWSVSARQVMNSNPGHYVALVVSSPVLRSENGLPVKQLKLLRPDDTLLIGQVYRLISFEDVLKEFAAKKCVKLGKLLKERGLLLEKKKKDGAVASTPISVKEESQKVQQERNRSNGSSSSKRAGRKQHHQNHGGGGQWKPALNSISEIGN